MKSPLVPLRLFKQRNLATADVVGVLWAAAMFTWFFLSALYLQLVLEYSPLQVGLAFLPGNLIMGALSIGLSAKLVMRFGFRLPLATGLGLASLGLLLFARAPVDGTYLIDVFPSMVLLGLGAGMAFNPVLLAAMSDVAPEESGLASGIINTSFMMGGALGLAVLASIADSRKGNLLDSGEDACERPHRRLPPRLPRRGAVRRGCGGDRRPAAAERGDARARACAGRARGGRSRLAKASAECQVRYGHQALVGPGPV